MIGSGGAPDWIVKQWMSEFLPKAAAPQEQKKRKEDVEKVKVPPAPVVGSIGADAKRLSIAPSTRDQLVAALLDFLVKKGPDVQDDEDEGSGGGAGY